jgi:hypothetical protein
MMKYTGQERTEFSTQKSYFSTNLANRARHDEEWAAKRPGGKVSKRESGIRHGAMKIHGHLAFCDNQDRVSCDM